MCTALGHVPVHLTNTIRSYHRLPPLQGRWVATWPLSFTPTGLAVALDGTVYITDFVRDSVSAFSAGGVFLRRWGVRGPGRGQFVGPCGIAVSKRGEVVVADYGNNRLQVFQPDGVFLRELGSADRKGGSRLRWPNAVAVTNDGEAVVVTEDDRLRFQVFRIADGALLWAWFTNARASGVCVTAAGQVSPIPPLSWSGALMRVKVLVANEKNHCIKVFGRHGTIRQWVGIGQMFRPSAVAMRGHEVIVVDTSNDCVQVFRLDGTFVRKWEPGDTSEPTNLVGVAATRQGHVLVCDSGDNCVHVFE